MTTKFYIPPKIHIGFQNRKDTYTGKLAFITYIDEKGLFRQENAWNGWRDKKIAPIELDNVPSRFIFNKDVKRSGHWSDVTKVRIYDSRDFEFEIDVSNMMQILMYSDISKRDIVQECVFAWNGKNLVLLPTNSEQYLESLENTKKVNTKFSLKDIVVGQTYSTKNNNNVIYLGHFEWAKHSYMTDSMQSVGKKHIFYVEDKYIKGYFPLDAKNLVEAINLETHQDFGKHLEKLKLSKNMEKAGKLMIEKGFDKKGFIKSSDNVYKVIINHNHFEVIRCEIKIKDDKPVLTQNQNRWNNYERVLREKKINVKDMVAVKQYFESIGCGQLYYENKEGVKMSVL